MVHRAICGSMERFAGILIEHFAGHFPLWLAPVQVGGRDHHVGGRRLCRGGACDAAPRAGLRVEADLRNEKINYKVREHSLAKVPVLLVVGKQGGGRSAPSPSAAWARSSNDDAARRGAAGAPSEAVPPDVRRAASAIGPGDAEAS